LIGVTITTHLDLERQATLRRQLGAYPRFMTVTAIVYGLLYIVIGQLAELPAYAVVGWTTLLGSLPGWWSCHTLACGRDQRAIAIAISILLTVPIAYTLALPVIVIVWVPFPIMAIAVAMIFLSGRHFTRLMLLSGLVFFLMALLSLAPPLVVQPPAPLLLLMVVTGLPASLAFTLLLLTFARQQLVSSQLHARAAGEDSLTGLANRRHLESYLALALVQVAPSQPLCLAMLDLDHLKAINDTFSHRVGDEVLRVFAQIINQHSRWSDLAARFGGEEFVLVMRQTQGEQAYQVCERLRLAVESYDWSRLHPELRVTASIGIAEASQPIDQRLLIDSADRAMYAAKRAGRNRVSDQPLVLSA
jgi:diguanylate cyclase (GGDEF)-like protein